MFYRAKVMGSVPVQDQEVATAGIAGRRLLLLPTNSAKFASVRFVYSNHNKMTHRRGLFLLRIKRKQIGDLLLQHLPLPLQTTNFLCGNQHFSRQLFLELFDVYYILTVSSMVATGDQSETILCTLIAVASFMASTNLSRSPRMSSDSSIEHEHIASWGKPVGITLTVRKSTQHPLLISSLTFDNSQHRFRG